MLEFLRKTHVASDQELHSALGEFQLPSFPAILNEALERLRDEHASLTEIAELVTHDPGVSVRLLSTVNSAAFGLRHHVRNVEHAVTLLGRAELESMLISMAVRDALPRPSAPGFSTGRFWVAAARRAVAARALAEHIDPRSSSASFTAGLLQDMALPVLTQHQGARYGTVLEEWHNTGEDLAHMERDVFGWDHAAIGARMCVEWKLPSAIQEAISAHHVDEDDGGLPAVSLVSTLLEIGEHRGVERLVETTHTRFALPRDQVSRIVATSFEEAVEIAALFV